MPSKATWTLQVRESDDCIPTSPFSESWQTAEWNRVYTHLHILPSMESQVAELIEAMTELKTINAAIRENRFAVITVTGQGAWRRSPILQMKESAETRISQIRDALALTPRSISRLNVGADGADNNDDVMQAIERIAAGRAGDDR